MQLRWHLKACSPAAKQARLFEGRWRQGAGATKPPLIALELAAKRRIASALCGSATAARWMLETAAPAAFRALILHHVADENLANLQRLVQFLLAERRILAPADVRCSLPAPAARPCRAPCLLTFDDGFLSQYRVAREILDPNGIKAVFFICPVLIDLAERGDYATIARNLGCGAREGMRPLMDWRHVQALAGNGHTIGAHSQRHRRLVNLPREVLEDEVRECGNRLERVARAPVEWFAYPFGGIRSIDERALRCVAARYTYCCSGIRGINTAATPRLAMLRDHLELDAPFSYLRQILDGALDLRYVLARRRLRRMAGAALSREKR